MKTENIVSGMPENGQINGMDTCERAIPADVKSSYQHMADAAAYAFNVGNRATQAPNFMPPHVLARELTNLAGQYAEHRHERMLLVQAAQMITNLHNDARNAEGHREARDRDLEIERNRVKLAMMVLTGDHS